MISMVWTSAASSASTAAWYPEPVPISERSLAGLDPKQVGHERDDVGLGDGLSVADGRGRLA